MAARGRRNPEMTLGFLALGALAPFSGANETRIQGLLQRSFAAQVTLMEGDTVITTMPRVRGVLALPG